MGADSAGSDVLKDKGILVFCDGLHDFTHSGNLSIFAVMVLMANIQRDEVKPDLTSSLVNFMSGIIWGLTWLHGKIFKTSPSITVV